MKFPTQKSEVKSCNTAQKHGIAVLLLAAALLVLSAPSSISDEFLKRNVIKLEKGPGCSAAGCAAA